jgi:hypothetical protein
MIPNLNASLEDKIIVLKFADQKMQFPANVEEIIARELPFFLRWLLDWQTPTEIIGDARFGIKAFIHEEIRAAAIHSGEAGDILEIIELWVRCAHPKERFGPSWHGTATEWVAEVSSFDTLKSFVTKLSARTLGRRLSELSRIRGSRVTLDQSKAKLNGNRYSISLEEDASWQGNPVKVDMTLVQDRQEQQAAA